MNDERGLTMALTFFRRFERDEILNALDAGPETFETRPAWFDHLIQVVTQAT